MVFGKVRSARALQQGSVGPRDTQEAPKSTAECPSATLEHPYQHGRESPKPAKATKTEREGSGSSVACLQSSVSCLRS